MKFDLSTPEGRAAAIQDAGPDAYNKMMEQFQKDSIVAIAYGHPIRLINSQRFGQLYSVGKTMAFQHLAGAKQWASENPKEPEPAERFESGDLEVVESPKPELVGKTLEELKERCPDCGARAASMFDHIDIDCTNTRPDAVANGWLRPGPEPLVMRAMERKPI